MIAPLGARRSEGALSGLAQDVPGEPAVLHLSSVPRVEIGGLAQVARGRLWTGQIPPLTSNSDSCSKMTACSVKERRPIQASGGCSPPFETGTMKRYRPSSPACSNSPTRLEMRRPADACGRTSCVEHVAELLTRFTAASRPHQNRAFWPHPNSAMSAGARAADEPPTTVRDGARLRTMALGHHAFLLLTLCEAMAGRDRSACPGDVRS